MGCWHRLVAPAVSLLVGLVYVTANETWRTITYDDFQLGWGNFKTAEDTDDAGWEEGGLWISNNNGEESSVFFSQTYNVSQFADLQVSFWFSGNDMEDGESFLLEYLDSPEGDWEMVEEYIAGVDFANNVRSLSMATFSAFGTFDLTDEVKIRFRCDAGGTNDFVFLSDVHFKGLLQPPTENLTTESPTLAVSSTARPSFTADTTNGPPATEELTTGMATENPPTQSLASLEDFKAVVCPQDRYYPPEKYAIAPYKDTNTSDGVQDDLLEVSSIAFSAQTDAYGNRYAYMVSDKEQYSLKVVRLNRNYFNLGSTFRGQGDTVATYTLFEEEPVNDDWEDISLGPCTDIDTLAYSQSEVCVYVGNIGNNPRPPKPQRKQLFIYKFVEPVIGPNGPQDQNVPFATIGFRYGDGYKQHAFYDAEALFVDWIGANGNIDENAGDIYIPTKGGCFFGGVGKVPVSVHRNLLPGEVVDYNMTRVVEEPPVQGNSNMTCHDPDFREWTGADLRRDGQLILLIRRGPPASVHFFPRALDQSIAEALTLQPCPFVAYSAVGLATPAKYEAVAFADTDGSQFADISECFGNCTPSLYQYRLVYPQYHWP